MPETEPNQPHWAHQSLAQASCQVLQTAPPLAKAKMARNVATHWLSRAISDVGTALPPDRPARPERPALLPPGQVPRRKINAGVQGRIALLHALAHIELNAIDLAFDIVVRFTDQGLPASFYDDWVMVGDDEARHFMLLEQRLNELGASYGDLPAHDGLWQASIETADNLMARLAIVPMVLEARGLDVTPSMIKKLKAAGDQESADILTLIHDEEINHVAAGQKWFSHLCHQAALPVRETWQDLVTARFRGGLKPPFNEESRTKAGLPKDFYAIAE